MPTATTELLAALAGVLEAGGHRWYLFGAQALAVHGRARQTEDVDVTVEAGSPATLWSELRAAGFVMRVADPEAFVARTHVLPLTYPPSGVDLDLIVAGSGLEALFLARARRHDLGGVLVPVISVEDFVIAKVLAQRPKDVGDIDSVLTVHPDLDVSYVRAVLTDLEGALAQPDLLPVFEAALTRRG